MTKMYIAVLDEVEDAMTPTLVAHAVLGAHLQFIRGQTDINKLTDEGPHKHPLYIDWLKNSFKKVVVRVNQTEFDRISALPDVYLGHEATQLDGRASCAVVCPRLDTPRVLQFARLWKPSNKEKHQ